VLLRCTHAVMTQVGWIEMCSSRRVAVAAAHLDLCKGAAPARWLEVHNHHDHLVGGDEEEGEDTVSDMRSISIRPPS